MVGKVQIKFYSYDLKELQKIIFFFKENNFKFKSIYLPSYKERSLTVLKSPFVYKKARDQFTRKISVCLCTFELNNIIYISIINFLAGLNKKHIGWEIKVNF